LKNLYECGTLSSGKMFGNDVALLLGMIERGEKEERKRADEEKTFFNGGFGEVLEVYSVQPAFVF